ncbi:hypothetical protein DY000_02016876 [Brassica cretica]|uniref:DUF1985 domain-containing protein n=1 Tax=Brassica cretica TaxID=69181 RepID=A0ABQ7CR06_BRACR|nr:hypothetical protein DY000_02016876 [Brassica cretica]
MSVVSGFENCHVYLVATQWLCENWKKPIGLPPMYLVLAPIIFGFAVYIKEQPLYFRGNIVAVLKFWFANCTKKKPKLSLDSRLTKRVVFSGFKSRRLPFQALPSPVSRLSSLKGFISVFLFLPTLSTKKKPKLSLDSRLTKRVVFSGFKSRRLPFQALPSPVSRLSSLKMNSPRVPPPMPPGATGPASNHAASSSRSNSYPQMTLNAMLNSPARLAQPHLHPDKINGALWFGIDPCFNSFIRATWQAYYMGPWKSWRKGPDERRVSWWQTFVQNFYWDPEFNDLVYGLWKKETWTTIGMAMDQLPKTLFKEGTETQVEKVMDIYVHKLQYSGRVIHIFVCKQLLTAKRHELWFHFARRALRFLMQEFHAITGLKYKDDEPDLDIDNWRGDKGFWSKLLRRKGKISLQQIRKVHLKSCNTWSHVDRLRMVYLFVIAGLVMAKDEKVFIPHKYIKLNSYIIDGFCYALQIWLMEPIPDIGSLLGKKLKECVTSMRCRNWKGSAKVSYEDIISIESDFASTGFVFPYISSTGNGNIIVDAGFERDDEMNDDLITDMYRKKYDWSKHVWGYQETEQPYADSSEDDGSKEEEAGERIEILGLDFSFVNDENIQEARHKIAFDLWEAANDESLHYRMSTFKPPKRAPEKTVELF